MWPLDMMDWLQFDIMVMRLMKGGHNLKTRAGFYEKKMLFSTIKSFHF